MRINRYVAESGICSRREADRLVEEGLVTINGRRAVPGSQVEPGDDVRVDGQPVAQKPKAVYLAMNKPEGITCTTDERDPDNIIDFLAYPERVFPIGRLDKDSTGLILLTNDGSIVNRILRAENRHEKEYVVTVDRPLTVDMLRRMANGVPILDTVTRPCKTVRIDETTFRITLTQGLNRQIRRMCEVFGCNVVRLERVRIMNIALGSLKQGYWRHLSPKELEQMMSLL